jgi:hypothetical protein
MRGFIFEGITGSGKTTLLRALTARWAERRRGPLWIATEHLTERVLEPLATASPTTALEHLEAHVTHLERLAAWDADAPRGPATETVFALERFHLSIASHISGLADHDWKNLDARLLALGTILVWCRLHPDLIGERAVRQTKAERAPAWSRWLDSLGNDEVEQTLYFRREQDRLVNLVGRSHLPVIELVLSGTPAGGDIASAVTLLERRLEKLI